MKKKFLTLLAFVCGLNGMKADEGMWMLSHISPKSMKVMKDLGLQMSEKEIRLFQEFKMEKDEEKRSKIHADYTKVDAAIAKATALNKDNKVHGMLRQHTSFGHT